MLNVVVWTVCDCCVAVGMDYGEGWVCDGYSGVEVDVCVACVCYGYCCVVLYHIVVNVC